MASVTGRLSKNSTVASKFIFDCGGGGGVGVLIARIFSIYDEDGLFLCNLSDDDEDRCVFLELEVLLLELLLRLDEFEELDDERLLCRLRCDNGDRESRLLCRLFLFFDDDLYRFADESVELSDLRRYFDDFLSGVRTRLFLECFDRDEDRRLDFFRDNDFDRDLPIFHLCKNMFKRFTMKF